MITRIEPEYCVKWRNKKAHAHGSLSMGLSSNILISKV